MVASIPASDIVNVLPGVIAAGGTGLDMVGLILTNSARLPAGEVRNFANATDVATYFGSSSDEAAKAAIYFNGYIGSFIKPAFVLFASYATAARAGWLRGAPLALTLTELQALSGTLTIDFAGSPITSGTIDLSAATSFSNAATIIQSAFTTPPFTVTYDSIADAFLFTSTTTGAAETIDYASGTLAASLNLTETAGATLSQGSDASVPGTAMDAIVAQTQDFVSFAHLFAPSTDDIVAFGAWEASKNGRFLYAPWTNDSAATTNSDTTSPAHLIIAANLGGVAPVWSPSADKAVFLLGLIASIDFSRQNGRVDIAGRRGTGLVADVTNQTIAANLKANGYNFYGQWATANDQFVAMRWGTVTGDFAFIDSYINAIWLNNQFQLSLMLLLQNVGHIPYNDDGYETIAAAIQSDIDAAVNFGAIVNGVTLSEAQISEINAIAGQDISDVMFNRGWFLSIKDPGPTVRAARGSPVCTFFYTDGQSVQKIDLSSLMVQ